jgi:hypothetical protein
MPIKNMTPEQIAEATRAQVTAGVKSTTKAAKLNGETQSEANARLTAAYKELVAKPILTQEQIDGGMKVQYVRTQAGGFGEYTAIKPPGYTGPTKVTQFTPGVIPEGAKYTTGSAVGLDTGGRTVDEYTKVLVGKLAAGVPLTTKERQWLDTKGSKTLNPNVTTVSGSTTSTTTNTGLKVVNGIMTNNGVPFSGKAPDGKVYTNGIADDGVSTTEDITPKAPVGTPPAYVYDPMSKTWSIPPKPTTTGNWTWDNNEGWVDTTVVPGSSGMAADGTKTLAIDTFRNTIGLLFGAKEASQPWVTALYTSASKFYNTGSTVDEAINLSLQDVRGNKELKPFTDRFKGIYALTDRLAKGEAIEVPTVAEYFKSESAMGDVLRAAGMGDLATQDFLGDVIGRGKSVLEVTNLITDTFDRIDNAPSALKADLQAYFPGADRTSIAKAMLTGEKGAAELTKKVKAISVQSAAKTQGVTISDLTSEDLAGQGYDYNQSLANFATVKQLERGKTLGKMSGIDFTQQEAIASTFQANAAAAEKARKIKEEEQNRFGGTSGKLASRNRAQGII